MYSTLLPICENIVLCAVHMKYDRSGHFRDVIDSA